MAGLERVEVAPDMRTLAHSSNGDSPASSDLADESAIVVSKVEEGGADEARGGRDTV